jgi:hypothetical protein
MSEPLSDERLAAIERNAEIADGLDSLNFTLSHGRALTIGIRTLVAEMRGAVNTPKEEQ